MANQPASSGYSPITCLAAQNNSPPTKRLVRPLRTPRSERVTSAAPALGVESRNAFASMPGHANTYARLRDREDLGAVRIARLHVSHLQPAKIEPAITHMQTHGLKVGCAAQVIRGRQIRGTQSRGLGSINSGISVITEIRIQKKHHRLRPNPRNWPNLWPSFRNFVSSGVGKVRICMYHDVVV